MTRTELFKNKRNEIAKTEYMIMERLNDLSEQIEALAERVDKLSEHLYYFAKSNDSESKNAFDEMFKDSIEELERLCN